MNMIKGLELSKAYYEAYGEPMLREQFPELLPYLAAGLAGSGSECFGYDDVVSQDHDFEPGFCLFLPDESVVDRKTAFRLERAFSKLPREFMGFRRSPVNPAGGARHGVIRTADFFRDKTGTPDGILTISQWLQVPSQSLAEAVNGTIFFDGYGEVTEIRNRLQSYPEDILRKKLAGHLILMAQAGHYNYRRCIAHRETGAAQLAVCEYVNHAAEVIFLLNGAYRPYYKWMFRALRALPRLSLHAELMEYLLTTDNEPAMAEEKYRVMEEMSAEIISELGRLGLSDVNVDVLTDAGVDSIPENRHAAVLHRTLENHAFSINDGIRDPGLRSSGILAGV